MNADYRLDIQGLRALAILLVWIAPIFNFSGHWDHFLSGSFYSARLPNTIFYFHPDDRFGLPESSRAHVLQVAGTSEYLLPLEFWALEELRTPGYPELRIRKQVARKLCACIKDADRAGLRITHKEGWDAHIRTESISCKQLTSGNSSSPSYSQFIQP